MVKWLCKAAYGPLVKGQKKYERGENPSYDPLFAVGNILRDNYEEKVIVLAVSEHAKQGAEGSGHAHTDVFSGEFICRQDTRVEG